MSAGRGTGTPPAVAAALGALAITGLVVGTWALVAPGHFFHQFPLGQGWVATDGPYNEHLVRDVGALNLALGIATAISLGARSVHAQSALAWGWAVDGIAHLVYHLHHLGPFDTATAVAVVVITASTPALAAVALVCLRGEPHRDRSARPVLAQPRR